MLFLLNKTVLLSSLNSFVYVFQIILSLFVNFYILSIYKKSEVGLYVTLSQLIFLLVQVAKFGIWDLVFSKTDEINSKFSSTADYIFLSSIISCFFFCVLIYFTTFIFKSINYLFILYFLFANIFFHFCMIYKININFVIGEFFEKICINLFFIIIIILSQSFQNSINLVEMHIMSYFFSAFILFCLCYYKKVFNFFSIIFAFKKSFWLSIWSGRKFFLLSIENNLFTQIPIFIIAKMHGLQSVADWNFIISCIKATMAPIEACRSLFRKDGLNNYKNDLKLFKKQLFTFSLISYVFCFLTIIIVFLLFDPIITIINIDYLCNKEAAFIGILLSAPFLYINLKASIGFLLADQSFIYKIVTIRIIALIFGCFLITYYFLDLRFVLCFVIFSGIIFRYQALRFIN